jgi:hypothetical protein
MKIAVFLFPILAYAALSRGDDGIDSCCANTPLRVDNFSALVDTNDGPARFESFELPMCKNDKFNIEDMGELSFQIYTLLTGLGRNIKAKLCQVKEMSSPKVQELNMGDLVFNVTFSYGLDFSHKQLNAKIIFDDIKKRRK